MFSAASGDQLLGLALVEHVVAPPLTSVWVSFSDSLRAAKVRREISNCRS